MSAFICYKTPPGCTTCKYHKFDKERGDYVCFAKTEMPADEYLKDYLEYQERAEEHHRR